MAEHPILFSAPMVRAILSGTKTQTRRAIKLKPWHTIEERDDGQQWPWMYDGERDADCWLPCPYGQPGDRLWVREAWTTHACFDHIRASELTTISLHYQADGRIKTGRNRAAMHMPRWASRISLEVTGVRVERLQAISEADARAEGARPADPCDHTRRSCEEIGCTGPGDYRGGYRALWDQINGPGGWDANPWVWVVEFKRVEVSHG